MMTKTIREIRNEYWSNYYGNNKKTKKVSNISPYEKIRQAAEEAQREKELLKQNLQKSRL